MDRDKRWDRNKLAWDAIVLGRGEQCSCSPAEYVEQCYSYFCTDRKTTESSTTGIMIYHKGNNIWVDALGREIK